MSKVDKHTLNIIKWWRYGAGLTNFRVGLCDGSFDLLHPGHVKHLRNCAKLCDKLVVAVADDESVRARKGKDRPIHGEDNRLLMINELKCVNLAFLCDGSVGVVNEIKPDFYFRNDDYVVDRGLDPKILLVRMPVYGSTTEIIKKIRWSGWGLEK